MKLKLYLQNHENYQCTKFITHVIMFQYLSEIIEHHVRHHLTHIRTWIRSAPNLCIPIPRMQYMLISAMYIFKLPDHLSFRNIMRLHLHFLCRSILTEMVINCLGFVVCYKSLEIWIQFVINAYIWIGLYAQMKSKCMYFEWCGLIWASCT